MLCTASRAQVVGLLEEDRVDVVELDEVFEFDRRATLRAGSSISPGSSIANRPGSTSYPLRRSPYARSGWDPASLTVIVVRREPTHRHRPLSSGGPGS